VRGLLCADTDLAHPTGEASSGPAGAGAGAGVDTSPGGAVDGAGSEYMATPGSVCTVPGGAGPSTVPLPPEERWSLRTPPSPTPMDSGPSDAQPSGPRSHLGLHVREGMDLLWRWRVLRTRRALLQSYGALLALSCVQHGLPWELAVVRER
jgi:hypothetical protein